jgi:hypothetical protein
LNKDLTKTGHAEAQSATTIALKIEKQGPAPTVKITEQGAKPAIKVGEQGKDRQRLQQMVTRRMSATTKLSYRVTGQETEKLKRRSRSSKKRHGRKTRVSKTKSGAEKRCQTTRGQGGHEVKHQRIAEATKNKDEDTTTERRPQGPTRYAGAAENKNNRYIGKYTNPGQASGGVHQVEAIERLQIWYSI